MAVRYAVVLYTGITLGYTVGNVILGYLFYVWAGSAYIFINFAVSHTHKPVIQPDEDVSWVRCVFQPPPPTHTHTPLHANYAFAV